MPAQSQQQQKFMGMVHALNKGDIKPSDVSKSVRDVAKNIKKSDAKDFASTKHNKIPKKVKQEILKALKEYANKMSGTKLGGSGSYDYAPQKGLRDDDGYDDNEGPKDEGFASDAQRRAAFASGYKAKGKKGKKKMKEGMFSTLDQIRQDSKNVRDFVKNVFRDRDFMKMKNDKEFIKYLKTIYEGVDESKGVPQNYMQGRVSDYHTALRGKKRDYSGGTNFKKTNHGQPDIDNADEDEEVGLTNKQTPVNENEQYVAYAYKGNKVVKTVRDSKYNDKLFSKFKKDMERKGFKVNIDLLKNRKVVRQVYRTNESVNERLFVPSAFDKALDRMKFNQFTPNNIKKLSKKFKVDYKDAVEYIKQNKVINVAKKPSMAVNEASMDWEKNFKWANDKELKVISKFIFMNPKGIDGVIKMSKHKPFAFRRTIQKAAKAGLYKESINEVKVETERFFGKKGIIIMIRDGNKLISAIFKDKKNADKFNRNKPADVKKLYQLAKRTKFPKTIDEYGQRLDLSYLEDEEAMLKGTPKPKDAIDRDIDEYSTAGSYEFTKGDQFGQNSVNEVGVFPVTNYISGIIPKGRLDTNTPEARRKSVKLVNNLRKTLNTFWKQNDIPFKIK
tara:strand:+ start:3864 stop:5711 length:1848 start_codon:yes stop_codon:yes gene_type:complete